MLTLAISLLKIDSFIPGITLKTILFVETTCICLNLRYIMLESGSKEILSIKD